MICVVTRLGRDKTSVTALDHTSLLPKPLGEWTVVIIVIDFRRI
jgi:hypothetical protein